MGDGRDWRSVLATTLLPHQIEAVEWMRTRETSDGGGGVLADDMGMGKTLDCIALATSTAGAAALWARAGALPTPRSAATLVVTPLCLLDQWRLQIGRHAPPRSSVVVYHGADRHIALASFLSRVDGGDVGGDSSSRDGDNGNEGCSRSDSHQASDHVLPRFVLTTYETMRHEYVSAAMAGRCRAFEVTWFRVVLDEAHRIRAAASGCHEAALALRAQRRWCVTGTPYNNSVDDLRALARFVGVAPYDSDTWWESPALGAPTRQARLHQWTRAFVLMRNKRDVLGDTLPPCTTTIVRVRMDAAERAFYDDLVRSAARAYAAFAAAPPRDRARPRMFGAVLAWVSRLRQACDHPLLAMGRGWTVDAMASGRDRGPARCGCCARLLDGDPAGGGGACVAASCGHRLCRVCAPAAVGASRRRRRGRALPCLPCRAALRWTAATATAAGPAGRERGSTKLRALVAYCVEALSANPTARIVVFSQWTACLDMAARLLTEAGVASVRYDGDVTGIARRAAVLATFAAAVGAQDMPPAPTSPTLPDELSSSSSSSSSSSESPSLGPRLPSGVAASSIGMSHSFNYGDRHREDTTEAASEPVDPGMRLRSGATVGRAAGGGAARVLLASLHCAGVGLDLSAANHVVLIDAWYNPFIEKQACDRVHRIGQTREVKVVRLCVAASVEADVARIQARKLREAAALGLGTHADTATSTTVAPSDESNDETNCPPFGGGDADRDGTRTGLSDTDIHEIFRRAMSRCRLCPVPAPAPRADSRSTTAVVAAGKRKRD
ncbi:SNF2 family DNA dependent ATPase [Pandoravirus dulcis]|uniref:SNF2 family DNA dependent ATPase n=1 Tax=Pandoravirus dulcis TaxID=1349409 RepID=S4VS81_9VIRU|nr:SNF2 family DNA dependent ATPase [Pandoravirus dulcis]AGO82270.1 SNF2 family DNA dependent ATPase [Pandoravirus dulcis]